jgi:hypothetical protein
MQDPSRVEVNEGSPVQLSVHVVRNAFDNAHRCHGLAGNPPEGRVGVVRPEETSCKALVGGVLQDAPRDGEVSESAAGPVATYSVVCVEPDDRGRSAAT